MGRGLAVGPRQHPAAVQSATATSDRDPSARPRKGSERRPEIRRGARGPRCRTRRTHGCTERLARERQRGAADPTGGARSPQLLHLPPHSRGGHRFVLAKHRLPCVSELVAGVGTPEPELRSLLHASRAPTCAEDVRLGALPRIVLPLDETALRARFDITTRVDATPEGIDQVFEVTRERIRPISAAARRSVGGAPTSRARVVGRLAVRDGGLRLVRHPGARALPHAGGRDHGRRHGRRRALGRRPLTRCATLSSL